MADEFTTTHDPVEFDGQQYIVTHGWTAILTDPATQTYEKRKNVRVHWVGPDQIWRFAGVYPTEEDATHPAGTLFDTTRATIKNVLYTCLESRDDLSTYLWIPVAGFADAQREIIGKTAARLRAYRHGGIPEDCTCRTCLGRQLAAQNLSR